MALTRAPACASRICASSAGETFCEGETVSCDPTARLVWFPAQSGSRNERSATPAKTDGLFGFFNLRLLPYCLGLNYWFVAVWLERCANWRRTFTAIIVPVHIQTLCRPTSAGSYVRARLYAKPSCLKSRVPNGTRCR